MLKTWISSFALCILSIASPVFRDMLVFPRPHDPNHRLPHVDLPETTTTLNILLRYIYPIPSPKIEDFTTLCNVLVSAEKYKAEGVTPNHPHLFSFPRPPSITRLRYRVSMVLHRGGQTRIHPHRIRRSREGRRGLYGGDEVHVRVGSSPPSRSPAGPQSQGPESGDG